VSVNGHELADLADFVRRVDAYDGLLDVRTASGGRLVLDAAAARASSARILERYRVPGDRSTGLA